MRLKRLHFLPLALVLTVGCTAAEKPTAPDDLLLRARFAGTTALLADTNAAYLTNFAALPQSAALQQRIVVRAASLPARFFKDHGAPPKDQGTNATAGGQKSDAGLEAVFAEWLQRGFVLELRGNKDGVRAFALGVQADKAAAQRWEAVWKTAATNWPAASKPRFLTEHSGGWFVVAASKTDASAAFAALTRSVAGEKLEPGAVLQGELVSSLIPGPVQRSVYGAFERLKLTVSPFEQSLRVRGTATYAQDLPKLGPPPAVPTNLVTESAVSFTMVREPGAWLEPGSPLRRFLPEPTPDVAWFWGGGGASYQLFMALPIPSLEDFTTNLGPTLVREAQPLAQYIGTGAVVQDNEQAGIQWRGFPFIMPKAAVKVSGTNTYLMAETFPQADVQTGLTPALIDRVTGRTNLLLYDWEFIQMRFDTWFRLGQLALLCANHEQIIGRTATLQWIQAVQLNMVGSGNTSTEITQTGPRELSLSRRGPLPFNSTELFWLANWFESPNFPDANFLVPLEQ